ncbi:predicted protein [Lichtheimia corymbifera JMRC:FSU:9682]|uniref:Uncharacterized protein n=1 Tax=Lichtheimia corymbifera JMRC:FSU:9682 TaxID=1263082 RepID=A0A068S893_9FUNG|nr:predicted protein [Lichtheimia corymbifera JMRC:FSU:9682]
MSTQVSTRHTIQRNNTMGPSTAIQDWELERVMTLSQLSHYRERVELLEKKAEGDKKMYDKHRLSLLREVKLKDSLAEKRIRDMEQEFLEQIHCMQLVLEQEKKEHEDQVKDLREHYELLLQTEQKKHERRISGFQQRLNAKTCEYAQLVENNIRIQACSPPPPSSHHQHHAYPPSPTSLDSASSQGDSEEESTIRLLQERLISLQSVHEQEKREWQAQLDAQQCELQQLRDQLKQQKDTNQQQPPPPSSSPNEYYLKGAQQVYEERLRSMEQKYEQKTRQIKESYRGDLAAMKDRFLLESQQVAMQHEARVQNLVSEHQHMIQEMKDEHENEVEVLRIEHQAALAEREREYEENLEHAIASCEQQWQQKVNDLEASMSKDQLAIRKHWETRVEKAASARQAEHERLQGELQVVKDRLGREIERRRGIQATLDRAVEEHKHTRKRVGIATEECRKLQRQQTQAHKLAGDLVLITDDAVDVQHTALVDLLHKAVSNVSNIHARQCILEQNAETSSSSFLGLSFASFF